MMTADFRLIGEVGDDGRPKDPASVAQRDVAALARARAAAMLELPSGDRPIGWRLTCCYAVASGNGSADDIDDVNATWEATGREYHLSGRGKEWEALGLS